MGSCRRNRRLPILPHSPLTLLDTARHAQLDPRGPHTRPRCVGTLSLRKDYSAIFVRHPRHNNKPFQKTTTTTHISRLPPTRPIYISAFIISPAADNTTKLNLGCPNYSYYPVRLNNGMRPAPTPCLLIQASGENAACPANGWINDHLQQPNSVWQKLLKRSKGFCRKFWPGSFYGPRRDVIQYHF